MNQSEQNNPALEVLKTTFGYDEFRGPQQAIINCLVDGEDAFVLMPTGGGKSICFQIPALIKSGTAIIISPLIALMQDQVSALVQLGIKAAFLNSSLPRQQAFQVEQQFINGQLDMLYIAPERLMTQSCLEMLEQPELALFAIDEAHCVSQWGHDFRPEYLKLSVLHERFPRIPRIALTATADEKTREEIKTRLNLEQAQTFISSFDRPNIHYAIQHKINPKQQLLRFIKNNHAKDSGIVYCMSRKKVESIAEYLRKEGFEAYPYHAGLDSETRQMNQDRFIKKQQIIIVATIAFGMGIDKPDVRFVAHLDLPKSLEAYYQETGRAGRDGLPANAWMVYGLQDVSILRQMLAQSMAGEQHKRGEHAKLESILAYCETTQCRRQLLLAHFGDILPEPCGNCDICLLPVETWDATEAAQMALSCVYHTDQRFGVNYLIDVLLGKDDQRIQQFGHDRISTFSIGQELESFQWRSVFRQLLALGYLNIDLEGYGSLRLTEKCRPLLRGQIQLDLRKDVKPPRASTKSKTMLKANQVAATQDPLWDELRALRQQLAEAQNVPPYVIFHDKTLAFLVESKPLSEDEMLEISGIGQVKLERYGQAFLEVIQDYVTTGVLNHKPSNA